MLPESLAVDTVHATIADTVKVILTNGRQPSSWDWFWPTLVGGLLAILGGFAAQSYRANIEEKRDKRQLVRFLEHALQGSIAVLWPLKTADPHKPRSWYTVRQLLNVWDSYDRLADRLVLLRDPAFQTRLHVYVLVVRMAAEGVVYVDDLIERAHREADSQTDTSLRRKQENEVYALDTLKTFHEGIDERVKEADALLKELKRQ